MCWQRVNEVSLNEAGDPYAIGAATKASVEWVECVRGFCRAIALVGLKFAKPSDKFKLEEKANHVCGLA